MAEKTLNTRILLKNADLSTWNSSTLVLKAGEVALAKIETTQHDAATGTYYKVPTYLMKVGDGTKTFSQLNWLAAPASDVHTWAKKEALDYADLPATLQTEIDNLQAAVGNGGSVDSRITAAINALKEACTVTDAAVGTQFVTAVAQTDGKIAVTRRALTAADIPTLEISKINGLQGALDAKAAKSDFDTLNGIVTNASTGLVKKLADEVSARDAGDDALQEQIDTLKNTTIPAVSAAAQAAQSTADTAKANAKTAQDEVDALEGVVATLTQTVNTNKTAAETAVSNEAKARADADTALQDAIDELAEAIGNVSNLMNFRGAVASKTAIEDPVEGDVIVITSGDDKGKEFVYSGGAWVEFGSVDAQQTAIDGLLTRMGAAEGKITNLENTRATTSALNDAVSSLEGKISAKADTTTVTGIGNRVTTLEGTVGDSSKGLVKDVADLKTTVGSTTSGLVKDVADLKTNSATKNELAAEKKSLQDAINLKADATDLTGVGNRVTALEGTVGDSTKGLVKGLADVTGTVGDSTKGLVKDVADLKTNSATKAELKAATDNIGAIKANYLKVDSNRALVDQDGDVLIIDCGGAQ